METKKTKKLSLFLIRCKKANELMRENDGLWAYEATSGWHGGPTLGFSCDISDASIFIDRNKIKLFCQDNYADYTFEIIELQEVNKEVFKTPKIWG